MVLYEFQMEIVKCSLSIFDDWLKNAFLSDINNDNKKIEAKSILKSRFKLKFETKMIGLCSFLLINRWKSMQKNGFQMLNLIDSSRFVKIYHFLE